jgi:hypothetical protein
MSSAIHQDLAVEGRDHEAAASEACHVPEHDALAAGQAVLNTDRVKARSRGVIARWRMRRWAVAAAATKAGAATPQPPSNQPAPAASAPKVKPGPFNSGFTTLATTLRAWAWRPW